MDGKKGNCSLSRSFLKMTVNVGLAHFAAFIMAGCACAQAVNGSENQEFFLRFNVKYWTENEPAYAFEVFGDGRVKYDGRYAVRVNGNVEYVVSKETLNQVIGLLAKSKLLDKNVQNHMRELAARRSFETDAVLEIRMEGEEKLLVSFGSIRSLFDESGSKELETWQSFRQPLIQAVEEMLGITNLKCPIPNTPSSFYCR